MTNELLDFLRNKVNSFIKWDLLRFFHDNPHMKETADNIARYTGRDAATIEQELNGLARVKVIETEDIAGYLLYRLSDDKNMRKIVNEFMEACHDRQFRVEAIHHMIQEMQVSAGRD